jgi:hypothetical protein
MNDSPIKIGIQDDFASDGLRLFIVNKRDSETSDIMRVGEHGWVNWERVNGMVVTDPTMTLPEPIGRVLLEALLRHYAGSQDLHTLRADLLHERGRVDGLITTVATLAGKAIDLADAAVENK